MPRSTGSPFIRFTIAATRQSGARPARAPWRPGSTRARDAGGGRIPRTRSAASTPLAEVSSPRARALRTSSARVVGPVVEQLDLPVLQVLGGRGRHPLGGEALARILTADRLGTKRLQEVELDVQWGGDRGEVEIVGGRGWRHGTPGDKLGGEGVDPALSVVAADTA